MQKSYGKKKENVIWSRYLKCILSKIALLTGLVSLEDKRTYKRYLVMRYKNNDFN